MDKRKNIKELKDYDLISEALVKFSIQDKKIEFIRHNENLTLKIDEKYLLRIHKPADSFQAISQYTDINVNKMREAELSFLAYLHKNGMNVQIPAKSKEETFVVELTNGICATMLQWIPGRIIEKEEVTTDLLNVTACSLDSAPMIFTSNKAVAPSPSPAIFLARDVLI